MVKLKAVSKPALPLQTLVLDNGCYSIKAGLCKLSEPSPSADPSSECRVIPNCVTRSRGRKVYIASEVESCADYGEMVYRRPMDKGSIVHWETQREIWDREFFGKGHDKKGRRWNLEPKEMNLILTETPTPLQALSTATDQIVFEDFGFASYLRTTPGVLIAQNDIQTVFTPQGLTGNHSAPQQDAMEIDPAPTSASIASFPKTEAFILVDSGFSSTQITAYLYGQPIRKSTRRLDIGGNFMTNYMKDIVSVRYYNMMDEDYTINAIKEEVCYVTDDFKRDMEVSWKQSKKGKVDAADSVTIDYVLPDWNEGRRGFSRPHVLARLRAKQAAHSGGVVSKMLEEEVMTLANERFTVPELLFNPANVGLNQAGIPGAIMQVLDTIPQELWAAMLANVVLVGGSALFPGFREKVERDLRMRVPEDIEIRVGMPERSSAITWACQGGLRLARDDPSKLKEMVVTKQEYEENGAQWTARRFAGMV